MAYFCHSFILFSYVWKTHPHTDMLHPFSSHCNIPVHASLCSSILLLWDFLSFQSGTVINIKCIHFLLYKFKCFSRVELLQHVPVCFL